MRRYHLRFFLLQLLIALCCIPVFTQTETVNADLLLQLIESWQQDAGMDLNGDGVTDRHDLFILIQYWKLDLGLLPQPEPPTGIDSTSPVNGDDEVAITRETIVRFSSPIDPDTITSESIYASFSGEPVESRIHISSDARTVTLFYTSLLPSSAQIRVTVNGDLIQDAEGIAIDPDGDDTPGGSAFIDFQTLSLTVVDGTIVCGRVFASQLAPSGSGELSMNEPLEGVTVTVDGREDELFAVTDEFGNFRLEPAPAGEFFVHIDGRTAENGVPEGSYYPFVGKSWVSTPGEEVNIGNIYLPLVTDGTLQPVSDAEDTMITFPESVVEQNPELEGVAITVPANSLFSDNGERGGMVGIAPVPPDRLPGELPEGLDFPIVITVQTDGATNFDEPAPICLPNLPDPNTGELLGPGEKSALWSFNHDTGRFEIIGSMTVSDDGTLVCTDPGVGILAPGWHGTRRGTRGRGGRMGGGSGGRGGPYEPGGKSHPNGCPTTSPCPQTRDPNIDPVYLFSGEFYMDEVDLEIPGRGFNFVWSRKYRSQVGPITEMGHSWDWSYNISIDRDGDNLILLDGNTRTDEYTPNGRGAWTKGEFFNEIVENPDGSYTMRFPDQSVWEFAPIDDIPESGKIISMADRNGNVMQFEYDGNGRLVVIIDTLDRPISLEYNEFGFISKVIDFAGREVSYEYYGNNEEGGNFSDLKSVTSPAVTDTPNGNDFPDGKTTSYTYTTGFNDERLNHNLLTVTDGRRNDPNDPTFGEGPYLINVYSETANPDAIEFDRVVRQMWGGDIIDLHYEPLIAAPVNGNAVMKTIMNDRNGNVKEYFWDIRNRGVRLLEFTGRADPTLPTTNEDNRPTGKLRDSDPDYFETKYEWNDDSQLKRTVYPNGNIVENVYESELNPDASPRSRGNIRIVRHLPGTHTPVGDQEIIEEYFEYDTSFGNACCGFNFVVRHTDGRGNETVHEYDDKGNRIKTTHRIESIVEEWEYNQYGQLTARIAADNGSGHRRRDEIAYYEEGPQRGYQRQEIIDAGGEALTTTYEYDLVGNVIRTIDPRGHDATYIVNELNQVVQEFSREVEDNSGVRYRRDYYYDSNNNVTRIDQLNLDENGQPYENELLSIEYEYEILNYLTRVSSEIDEGRFTVKELEYDNNRNKILLRTGEAVSGAQPNNTLGYIYDERDLVYQKVLAAGGAEQTSTQYDYDRNRNLVLITDGLENKPRITTRIYDGYDRMVEEIDPMGNSTVNQYDENGNIVGFVVMGELNDQPGSAGNIRLAETSLALDEMDRQILIESRHFDPRTQEPFGDGNASMATTYSDVSQVLSETDDNGNVTEYAYDSVNRLQTIIDAKGNVTTFTFDENSNTTERLVIEKSDRGMPDEEFTTQYSYDNHDRLIRQVDNDGNVYDFRYDSRNNLVYRSDAARTAPDQPGNRLRTRLDGINRIIESTRILTDTGDGSGSPVDEIVTRWEWDDNSRLTARIDDNGNATRYEYDSLGRVTKIAYADGTERSFEYDVHSNPVLKQDANGNEIRSDYDLLDRLAQKTIATGSDVSSDTTFERFSYDGLSRAVSLSDDDSVVERAYDSLSNMLEDKQNGVTTATIYDGMGNGVSHAYPGGRELTSEFDELNRPISISDANGVIAQYSYFGPGRVERRVYGNGASTEYFFDRIRRINRIVHSEPNGEPFDDRLFEWDRMSNKIIHQDALDDSTHRYSFDSAYRLEQTEIIGPDAQIQTIAYGVDGVNNFTSITGVENSGSFTMNPEAPEPADFQLNQYTTTPFDSRDYDQNGNLIRITENSAASAQIEYDYRNQMIAYIDMQSGDVTRYAYDVLGRRISKQTDSDGQTETIFYFYNKANVCEERNADGDTLATYVYGLYIDETLTMQRGGEDYYYHADDLYSTRKLTGSDGAIVEEYEYSDYGEVSILSPAGELMTSSVAGNPYLFTGRRLDAETGWHYFRARYLDPEAGRFTTRDPIGIWGDSANLGNGYAYTGNNPVSMLDPTGMNRERSWTERVYLWGRQNFPNPFDSDVRQAAGEIVWDRTNGLLDTVSGNNLDLSGFHMTGWNNGRSRHPRAHTYDPRERASEACFMRCWASRTADALLMARLGAAKGKIGNLGVLPVSPVATLAEYDPEKSFSQNVGFSDEWEDYLGAGVGSAGRTASRFAEDLPRLSRRFWRSQWYRSGGSRQFIRSGMNPRHSLDSYINRRVGNAQKWAGRLDKLGKGVAGLGLAIDLYRCYRDCEKDPCSHQLTGMEALGELAGGAYADLMY